MNERPPLREAARHCQAGRAVPCPPVIRSTAARTEWRALPHPDRARGPLPKVVEVAGGLIYGTTICTASLGWLSPAALRAVTVIATVNPAVRPLIVASASCASWLASSAPPTVFFTITR